METTTNTSATPIVASTASMRKATTRRQKPAWASTPRAGDTTAGAVAGTSQLSEGWTRPAGPDQASEAGAGGAGAGEAGAGPGGAGAGGDGLGGVGAGRTEAGGVQAGPVAKAGRAGASVPPAAAGSAGVGAVSATARAALTASSTLPPRSRHSMAARVAACRRTGSRRSSRRVQSYHSA